MKYRVGDIVVCNVELRKDGKKYLLTDPKEDTVVTEEEFQIIAIQKNVDWYTLLLPEGMDGWNIGDFLITFSNVPKAFKGRKYWDITEHLVLRKKR